VYIFNEGKESSLSKVNLKYLKLCSDDEQRSYGLGMHEGESLMTIFIFG